MTPEEQQAIKTHTEAIAAILYRNTDPQQLKTLETIEQAVRDHLLTSVSPQIGLFLSKQPPKPVPDDPAPSKASSEPCKSPINKPKP